MPQFNTQRHGSDEVQREGQATLREAGREEQRHVGCMGTAKGDAGEDEDEVKAAVDSLFLEC